jgi:hypothetical protein
VFTIDKKNINRFLMAQEEEREREYSFRPKKTVIVEFKFCHTKNVHIGTITIRSGRSQLLENIV